MRRNTALPIAILIVALGLAAWAFSSMIGQRFASGEVFPPYSSLRSDPLGSRALYDSLDRLEGITVERNYQPLNKLDGAAGSTLMLLHVEAEEISAVSEFDGEAVRKFALQGGRVVITIDGQESNWEVIEARAEKRRKENARERRKATKEQDKKTEGSEDEPPGKKGDAPINSDPDSSDKTDAATDKKAGEEKAKESSKKTEGNKDQSRQRPRRALGTLLSVGIEQRNFVMTPKGAPRPDPTPALGLGKENLPPWYSKTVLVPRAIVVKEDDDETEGASDTANAPKADLEASRGEVGADDREASWTVLATLDEKPVVAERRYGRGSIVLVTDSYFSSNEALFKEPSAAFLAALAGPSVKKVIFDETHLGTQETPGIMTLSRRLHLQGLFVGGILLFGLFIWQSSTSLVPHSDGQDNGPPRAVSGHGATTALVSLLRRGIPKRQLLAKCFEAWEKSARSTGTSAARVSSAQSVIDSLKDSRPARGQVAVLYQQICAAVHESASRSPRPKG